MGYECYFLKLKRDKVKNFFKDELVDKLANEDDFGTILCNWCSSGSLLGDIVEDTIPPMKEGSHVYEITVIDFKDLLTEFAKHLAKLAIERVSVVNAFHSRQNDEGEEIVTLFPCDGVEVQNSKGFNLRIYTDDFIGSTDLFITDDVETFNNLIDYIKSMDGMRNQIDFNEEELFFIESY